jgi:predicted P-loop ATPase
METVVQIDGNNRNEILEAYIKEKLCPRYNVVKSRIEVSKDGGNTYQPIIDRDVKSFLRQMKSLRIKTSIGEIDNILGSDFSPIYNPFEDYFTSLEWDGADHIGNLLSLVDVKNNQYFDAFFRKWIVAVVACALDPNETNEQMLVFYGGQGVGKTTFMSKLIPTFLNDYAHTGSLSPDKKDDMILLGEIFLCNLDELSSLTPKNIDIFKQILSMKKTTGIRRAYARYSESMAKHASFCGSTNNKNFLFDKTGNRRFLCFEIESIDIARLREINIDKVYAQVVSMYIEGFQYWFSSEENKTIDASNEEFVYLNEFETVILEEFFPTEESELKLTPTQVRNFLVHHSRISQHITPQKIGIALTNLGFKSGRSNGRTVYTLGVHENSGLNSIANLSVFKNRPSLPPLKRLNL